MGRSNAAAGRGYPAGILKTGGKARKSRQTRAQHHHRASPVAKKAGMDRKFNVGNLSARRATSSMARALGTKHEPLNRNLANGQRAINEPVVLSIYSIGWHLGYPIPTDPKSNIQPNNPLISAIT